MPACTAAAAGVKPAAIDSQHSATCSSSVPRSWCVRPHPAFSIFHANLPLPPHLPSIVQRTAPGGAERPRASHTGTAGLHAAGPAPTGLALGASASLGMELRIPQITFRRPIQTEQVPDGLQGRRCTAPGGLRVTLPIPSVAHSVAGAAGVAVGSRRVTTGGLPASPIHGIPSQPPQHGWCQQQVQHGGWGQRHAQQQAQQAQQQTVSIAGPGPGPGVARKF